MTNLMMDLRFTMEYPIWIVYPKKAPAITGQEKENDEISLWLDVNDRGLIPICETRDIFSSVITCRRE